NKGNKQSQQYDWDGEAQVYLCFSVPIVLLALFVAFIRDGSIPGFTVISALVLNAILGFGLLWIACKVYNWVAEKFGGIELALKELPEETDDIQQ
ncbi:MAG: hypothetical protein EBW16_07130, partial [Burkholderiaceae bacterium]|nr:hypothetical protein [Burkholderiaceae bacterium]